MHNCTHMYSHTYTYLYSEHWTHILRNRMDKYIHILQSLFIHLHYTPCEDCITVKIFELCIGPTEQYFKCIEMKINIELNGNRKNMPRIRFPHLGVGKKFPKIVNSRSLLVRSRLRWWGRCARWVDLQAAKIRGISLNHQKIRLWKPAIGISFESSPNEHLILILLFIVLRIKWEIISLFYSLCPFCILVCFMVDAFHERVTFLIIQCVSLCGHVCVSLRDFKPTAPRRSHSWPRCTKGGILSWMDQAPFWLYIHEKNLESYQLLERWPTFLCLIGLKHVRPLLRERIAKKSVQNLREPGHRPLYWPTAL